LENRKLADWASVAEIIGAAAIVISLIYVGIQVNDSTRGVRSATANDAAALTLSWYVELASDTERGGVFYDAITDFESLSPNMLMNWLLLTLGGLERRSSLLDKNRTHDGVGLAKR
jgi:hypothetical protein